MWLGSIACSWLARLILFGTTLNAESFKEMKMYDIVLSVCVPMPEWNCVCSYFLYAVALFWHVITVYLCLCAHAWVKLRVLVLSVCGCIVLTCCRTVYLCLCSHAWVKLCVLILSVCGCIVLTCSRTVCLCLCPHAWVKLCVLVLSVCDCIVLTCYRTVYLCLRIHDWVKLCARMLSVCGCIVLKHYHVLMWNWKQEVVRVRVAALVINLRLLGSCAQKRSPRIPK